MFEATDTELNILIILNSFSELLFTILLYIRLLETHHLFQNSEPMHNTGFILTLESKRYHMEFDSKCVL